MMMDDYLMDDYLIVLNHQERLDDARRQLELLHLVSIGKAERYSPIGAFFSLVTAGAGRLAERGSRAVRSALAGPSEPSEQCC